MSLWLFTGQSLLGFMAITHLMAFATLNQM